MIKILIFLFIFWKGIFKEKKNSFHTVAFLIRTLRKLLPTYLFYLFSGNQLLQEDRRHEKRIDGKSTTLAPRCATKQRA